MLDINVDNYFNKAIFKLCTDGIIIVCIFNCVNREERANEVFGNEY